MLTIQQQIQKHLDCINDLVTSFNNGAYTPEQASDYLETSEQFVTRCSNSEIYNELRDAVKEAKALFSQ